MQKATWYYARGRQGQFDDDVRELQRCGVRTVLFNSPDEATTAAFAQAAAGAPLELHLGASLSEVYRQATGQPPPAMAIPRRDEFVTRFGERILPAMVCWSAVTDPAALGTWLADWCRRGGVASGVSLDVLRYMNTVFWEDFPCECDACRARREPWLGHGVLTAQDRADPSVMYAEIATKVRVIGGIARQLSQAVRGRGLAFSVAVRAVYAGRDTEHAAAPMWGYGPALFEGQDWAAWCREGLLDAVHFMNYTPRRERFERLARQHRILLAGSPVVHHEGIGVTSSAGTLSPGGLAEQIAVCEAAGIPGITLFPWHGVSPEHRAVLAGS